MPASGADLRSSLRLFATEKPRSEWETLSRSRVLSDMKETGAPDGKSAGIIESLSNMVMSDGNRYPLRSRRALYESV